MPRELNDTKANFICPRCQRIYYQVRLEVFNEDPKKATRDAKIYKRHYHSCKKKTPVRRS